MDMQTQSTVVTDNEDADALNEAMGIELKQLLLSIPGLALAAVLAHVLLPFIG